jgi:hypothetical protein
MMILTRIFSPLTANRLLASLFLVLCMGISLLQAQEAPEGLMEIHEAYSNGDFDEVIRRVEKFQEEKPRHTLSDSIFVAKHLAVVYAANPRTREKGRYYMFRLLEMNPTADLVDMFVSEELDQTFEKVRKEFSVRERRSNSTANGNLSDSPSRSILTTPPANTQSTSSTSSRPPSAQKKEGGSVWVWVTGGVVVAAAAVTLYFLTLENPGGTDYSI